MTWETNKQTRNHQIIGKWEKLREEVFNEAELWWKGGPQFTKGNPFPFTPNHRPQKFCYSISQINSCGPTKPFPPHTNNICIDLKIFVIVFLKDEQLWTKGNFLSWNHHPICQMIYVAWQHSNNYFKSQIDRRYTNSCFVWMISHSKIYICMWTIRRRTTT